MYRKPWESPKQKPWFMLVLDGRAIGCFESSQMRLRDRLLFELSTGIKVLPATDEVLIQFRASTNIPYHIKKTMKEYAWSSDFRLEK